MYNPILHTASDTIPFHLKRVEESIDTFSIGFTPFDYIPTNQQRIHFDVDSVVDAMGSRIEGVPLMFSSTIHNTIFIVFLCCFLLLAIFTRREGVHFVSNLKAIISFSAKNRSAFKEQITISSVWVNVYLVIQTLIISSIAIAAILFYKSDPTLLVVDNMFLLLGYLFVGILLFVLIKYVIYVVIDYTFPDWKLKEWFSQYFTVIGVLGLAMFFPVLLVTFAPELFSIAMWLLLCVLSVVIFFYYRSLLIVFVKNNIGLLNYFLYLCAIEIVPLFLIYRAGMILANIVGK